MSILIKHVLRNVKENKFRSGVIICIVFMSVAVSFVVFNLQDIIVYNYDKVYNASKGEANITIQRTDKAPYLSENFEVGSTEIEKRSDVFLFSGKYDAGQFLVNINIIGMVLDEYRSMDAVSLLNVQEGFTLRQDECVISKRAADQYGLSVGDHVSITIHEQEVILSVAAIAETNRTFYEEKGNFQLLIPIESANLINQTSGMVTKTRLKVSDTIGLTDTVRQLQERNSDFIVSEGEEFESLHYQLSSITGGMLILVFIIVFISFYILFSLVKLIMAERLAIIGTFRSVGASRWKTSGILLLEFLSYGAIGTFLGLIAAVPLLSIIADSFNQYKEFGVATEVTYGIGYGIAAICIGLFLPALSALSHIIKTSRVSLKEIILKPSAKNAETSTKKLIIAVAFALLTFILYYGNRSDNMILGILNMISLICSAVLFLPIVMTAVSSIFLKVKQRGGAFMMGLKNLKSNRTVRNNGSMMVVIILVAMMMFTLIDKSKSVIAEELAHCTSHDIIVTLNNESNIKASDIQEIEGVDDAFNSYEFMLYGDYANGSSRVYGIERFDTFTKYMPGIRYSEGDFDQVLQDSEQGIIIDQYWAWVQGLSVGDSIPMYADEQRTKKIADFKVAGFWDSSSGTTDRAFVAIALDDYEMLISDNPTKILIKTASEEQVARQISEQYINTTLSAVTFDDYLSEQLTAIDSMFATFLACVFLGSIIIIFGIASNLIVAFIRMKKEYAIMYSVCMSKEQLSVMLVWEMLFSYLSIWIVSSISAFILTKLMIKVTSGANLAFDYSFNPSIFLTIIAVVLIVQIITIAFPINKIKNLNVVEELKNE